LSFDDADVALAETGQEWWTVEDGLHDPRVVRMSRNEVDAAVQWLRNLAQRLDQLERLAAEILNTNQGPVYLREGAPVPDGIDHARVGHHQAGAR
jgi:hypothetical protein